MRFARYLLDRQPLISAFITLVLAVIVAGTLQRTFTIGLDAPAFGRDAGESRHGLDRLAFVASASSGRAAGITARPRTWGKYWWLPVLAMCPLMAVSYLVDSVDWNDLRFTAGHAIAWALRIFHSGFFEESVFRGAIFFILYRAWGSTRTGVHKAALTQALMFGALHLTSLMNRDLSYVLYQICFASLIGYGFAGLVAYSRSLWPAIVLHGSLNGAGSIDNFFAGPGYVFPEETLGTMVLVVGAFFVFGALPGYWCLQRARLAGEPGSGGATAFGVHSPERPTSSQRG